MDGSATAPDHRIAIVGAGFSGLGAAITLKRAGIYDFVIFERADDIGGTWRQNTYPDVAVDIPSFSYQFSFELNPNWSRVFAKGGEVKEYVDHVADKYEVRPHVRLNTAVASRAWDEDEQLWRLDLGDREVTARYVIAAVGAFIDPRPPDIPGYDDFGGKVIRSQEWDHDYDLGGKRVAVIGTGSTAVQLIPPIARIAGRLDVYQRRPIWVFSKADYKIPRPVRWAFGHVPGLQRAVRFVASSIVETALVGIVTFGQRFKPLSTVPAWACKRFLHSQVKDPELRRKLTPDHGFGCKRPSVSNRYYRTFTRENVDLVTDGIERITPTGIRTVDGREREIDVLVLATGFRVSTEPENYRRWPVHGRDGFDLADFVEKEPLQAYEGVSIPGLPNQFTMFGPYSWTGSSWHVMVENQSRHIVRVLREAERRGAETVEIRPEANARFLEFVRHRAATGLPRSPTCSTANTYYLDHHGEISLLRPTSSVQAWWASRRFSLDDYEYGAVA
jgi:cation diffusion facilitator CzcD-associated flavoprotein CzcO